MTGNPPIKTYVNKLGSRIKVKIRTEYYLEILAPKTMKLLGNVRTYQSTNNKIISIMSLNKIEETCTHLFQINNLIHYYIFHQKIAYFQRHLIQSFYLLKYDLHGLHF